MRLVIQQPALPHFRVPFFRELARRPGLKTVLYYAESAGTPNAQPDGFEARYEQQVCVRILSGELLWHSAQWRHLNRGEADVACLSWNVRYLSLLPSLLRARARGIPVVLWGHGRSKNETAPRRRLRSLLASLGSALVFYNQRTADDYLVRGWARERVYVAPNSLDQAAIENAIAAWAEKPEQLEAFRKMQSLKKDYTLIYVGRIYKRGFDVLLAALARVRTKLPQVKLVVIGKLSEESRHLESLASELGLEGAVRWLGPLYDETQIAPWMLSATAMCFPRQIGLSLMHGMGYGLPVITDDDMDQHGPEIEALRDGFNGRLYHRGSPESLADIILQTLSDKRILANMSAAAKHTVETEYNMPKMADGFLGAVTYAARHCPR